MTFVSAVVSPSMDAMFCTTRICRSISWSAASSVLSTTSREWRSAFSRK